jgi:septal ring-binding cell division protein DamX
MEQANTYQLELFTPQGDSGVLKPKSANNSFLSYIRAWEKTILIIIGIVIASIISFSLGVEKGKRFAAQKSSVNFDLALNTQAQAVKLPAAKPEQQLTVVKPAQQPAVVKPVIENKTTIRAPVIKGTIENYTIQVASYKSKSYAQKEADTLKKQGFVTLTLAKGNFIVLCVGNFNSKESAQSLVSQLKKRYQGCTIRRL